METKASDVYRIAICDDEPLLAQRNEALTREILTEDGLVEGRDFALEVYTAPQALLERLRQEPDACQLVLLDVQIQEMNGLDVGRALLQYGAGCRLVYITAFRDYVFDSFETHPLQYLLKPVEKEKLAEVLRYDFQHNYRPGKVFLPAADKGMPVVLAELYYMESAPLTGIYGGLRMKRLSLSAVTYGRPLPYPTRFQGT